MRRPGFVALIACLAIALPGMAHAQALRGKVIVQGDGPASEVEIRLLADSAGWLVGTHAFVRTDSFGDFLVMAPAMGRYSLEAKKLGIAPVRTSVFALMTTDTAELLVRTVRIAPVIAGVTVTGATEAPVDFTRGFAERKAKLSGTFLDRAEIEKRAASRTFDMLYAIPGLRVIATDERPGFSEQRLVADRGARSLRGGSACLIATFVDGIEYEQTELSRTLGPNDFEAIEFYSAAETPVQFRKFNATCGTLLFWTRVTSVTRKKKS